jgi:hypothetical protein
MGVFVLVGYQCAYAGNKRSFSYQCFFVFAGVFEIQGWTKVFGQFVWIDDIQPIISHTTIITNNHHNNYVYHYHNSNGKQLTM